MKFLITGANGQLGRCLQDRLQAAINSSDRATVSIEYRAVTRQRLDIGDREAVLLAVDEYLPDVIINAAAYTAVDKAEEESDEAFRINADGPHHLAEACSKHDIPLMHVSTDYVFDGQASHPYLETDLTNPLGVYGASKLVGERYVATCCKKHVIVRTAWVFSEYGNNFMKTMLRLAGEREVLGVVADQQGAPTYAGDLAEALIAIALQLDKNPAWGLYHYCGGELVSWYDFAMSIFEKSQGCGELQKLPKVNAITSDQFPTPVKRPAYSGLSGRKLASIYGVDPGDWQRGVDRVLYTYSD